MIKGGAFGGLFQSSSSGRRITRGQLPAGNGGTAEGRQAARFREFKRAPLGP